MTTSSIVGAAAPATPAGTGPPRRPVVRPLADLLPERGAGGPVRSPAPRSTPPPAFDARAHAMAHRVLRGAVEVVGGHRPAHQLADVLRPGLLDYLVELRTAVAPLGPRIGRVHSQLATVGVLETVALVAVRTGVRAFSARFERRADTAGWQCTVLHLALTRGDVRRRGR